MSIIPSVSASTTYAGYVSQLDTKIADLQTQLKTGKKTLTDAEQTQVTTLSGKLPSLATTAQTITKAADTIGVAQTGLSTVKDTLAKMQLIASQASGGTAADNYFLDRNFQQLFSSVTETILKASLNNTNLLNGTGGLWVQTGVDNTPANRFKVNSIDMYGMMTMGVMSGVSVDTPENANLAIQKLSQAMASVNNGQAQLNASHSQLTGKATGVTTDSTQTAQSIADMQKVNVAQLKQQLSILQGLQSSYSDMVSQMGPSASTEFMLLG